MCVSVCIWVWWITFEVISCSNFALGPGRKQQQTHYPSAMVKVKVLIIFGLELESVWTI